MGTNSKTDWEQNLKRSNKNKFLTILSETHSKEYEWEQFLKRTNRNKL
jgi:hypothetical protein